MSIPYFGMPRQALQGKSGKITCLRIAGKLPPMAVNVNGLRAALFDLDGTLVRTFIDFPGMRTAMHDLAARYGATEAVGDADDILEIVRRTAEWLDGDAGKRARDEAYAILEAMEREGCAHPKRIEGASELLRELRDGRGVPVGIITRNARAVAEDLLERMDLPHDVLVAREDMPEFKPHPAPVLSGCARLGVAPADASLVGDLWADIASGKAAGVRLTVGIQWPHDPPDRFARCRPDVEVASLAEAGAVLLGGAFG